MGFFPCVTLPFVNDKIHVVCMGVALTCKVEKVIVTGRNIGEHIGLMAIKQNFAGKSLIFLSQILDTDFEYFCLSIEAVKDSVSKLLALVPMANKL